MSKIVSGACLCAKVRFEIALPSLWCAHCHCTMCRRAHGSAMVTWVGVADSAFTLQSAADLRWYASSPGAERGFCSCCGSPMFFRSSRWPGEMHVALASLHAPIDRLPQLHVFHDECVPWLTINDGLPTKGAIVD